MLTTFKGVLLTLVAVYLLALCALYLFQRNLLYYPRHADVYAAEHNFELDRGDVVLRGWVLNPDRPKAILYYGGNAERIDANIDWLRAVLPEYAIYLVNYRGYGESEGRPTETGLYADALAVYDHVAGRHESVGVFGRSLGTAIAIYVAASRPVDRVALVTPFDSIVNVASSHYGIFPVRRMLKDRYESWIHARAISAPTLVLYAEDDYTIPAASTLRLLEQFDERLLDVVKVEDANHNDISGRQVFVDKLRAFWKA